MRKGDCSSGFAAVAITYARDVVERRVPACLQIRQSAARFLEDVNGDRWTFNANLTARACLFIQALPHTEGQLAGQLIRLEPWQVWILATLFGLVDGDGLRKHSEAFLLIPRKNGKSTLAAGIALYMLLADGEAGAQVYIGANSEKQANFCFTPARKMAMRARGLAQVFGHSVTAASIFTQDGGYLQRMIGKPGDGSNPHCAILDEAHENDTADQYDTMKTGMGARRQPLLVTITTAGTNTAGPCRDLQGYAEQVLAGQLVNDRLFAAIYSIDIEDDWKDFACWPKANPNCGVSFSEDKLREYHAAARSRPAKKVSLCTKHLNVWQSSSSAWINMVDWDACATAPPIEELYKKDLPAWIGLDTATRQDVSALALLVRYEGRTLVYPFLFLPQGAVEKTGKNEAAYREWIEKDFLIATEGDATDFSAIEAKAIELADNFNIQTVGYDPWQGHYLGQRLAAAGMTVVEFGQKPSNTNPVMLELESLITTRTLGHPNNPALNWMAGNVAVKPNARDMLFPNKPDGQRHLKIDGMVAAIMALGLAMVEEKAPREYYFAFGS